MRILVAIASCLFVSAVRAGDGTVSASGTAEIGVPAKSLPVRVEVMTRGKDLKEALAKLAERRTAARTLLASLGAVPDSIAFTEPGVSTEKLEGVRQMEVMLARLKGRPGAKPAEAKAKTGLPVFVVASLRADLPLKETISEALLIAGQELQDKVRAADLGGMKETEKLTPQEEELIEEMGGNQQQNGEPKTAEPTFLYVGTVPEADREKALADAFQRARRDATRLARAAGTALGPVFSLTEATQPGDADDPAAAARRYYYEMAAGRREIARFDDDKIEATGALPGRVVLRIGVTAQFVLKGAEK